MKNYRITMRIDGKEVETLADILPDQPGLRMIMIGTRPMLEGVRKGHYFQGRDGRKFWNKLKEYGILHAPVGKFEDNYLLSQSYGITDIVKSPANFGNKPTSEQDRQGCTRILKLIEIHHPQISLFVYKTPLDKILKYGFGLKSTSQYGFNPKLENRFHCKIFVCPLPGVGGVPKEAIDRHWNELARVMA